MAGKQLISTERMKTALTETHGLISLAADRLGCDYTTIWRRVKQSKELRRVISHYRKRRVDMAEIKLDVALQNGDPWAVALVLKTLGKKRGYVERIEQEVSGRGGKAIEIKATDYRASIAPLAPGSVEDSQTPGENESDLHGAQVG